MIYSNACSYAIRALTRLALVRPEGYVLLDELCEGTDLPRHFVAKIFQDLVRKGLLISAKGRGGGFALAKPPTSMTLYEVVAAVDGDEQFTGCVIGMTKCDDHQPCPQHDEWKVLRQQIETYLHQTTLASMAQTLDRKMQLVGVTLPQPRSRSKPVQLPS